MKHENPSLLERAAQVYDLTSILKGGPAEPVQAPATEPSTRSTEPAGSPPAADPAIAPRRPEPEPAAAASPRPLRRSDAGRRSALRSGVVAIDRNGLAEAGHIVPEAPVTGLAEEFRLVKRRLIDEMEAASDLAATRRRSVLVCSSQAGDGKTFCALNLALSLAGEEGTEVLLVDGDFSKPDLLPMLGVGGGPGLVDALADDRIDPESLVIPTDIGGLLLLPAGRRATNVPELIASPRTRRVMDQLLGANPHRLLVFDSPPALMSSIASILAGHVGQCLVVVRADRTTEADLRETVGLLSGCANVGLLLNGAALAVSSRNYGGYGGRSDES